MFLVNLLLLLEPSSENLSAIFGGDLPEPTLPRSISLLNIRMKLHYKRSINPLWWSTVLWICKNIAIQVKMTWEFYKIKNKTDIVLFCGTGYYLPCLLLAKIMRKKTVLLAWGLGSMGREKSGLGLLLGLLKLMDKLFIISVDNILVETNSAIDFLGLTRYKHKVIANGARFIDFHLFKITEQLSNRHNIVGYIGRLDPGKGIENFTNAISLVLQEMPATEFLIGGDGISFEQIKLQLKNSGLVEKVRLTGWIPHDDLPNYLNQLKLLVLPSYSEGLPTILLEAMACGTPVLATNVGGIPDMIEENKTGFIIKNNSPECIAQNISDILNYPNLDKIAQSARVLVVKEFSYDRVVTNYEKIIRSMLEVEVKNR